MKLSCTQENLQQGLAITSHIGAKAMNLPVLNNVLLKAESFGLRLLSTTGEMTVSCLVRGKVDQVGEYTVPGKLFHDYVNLLPNDRIDIDLLDHAISVIAGSSKTTINGIPASEYPLIVPVTGGVTFSIPAAAFDVALGRVLFAAATNEANPRLVGACMSFSTRDGARTLTMAATDGYRLSEQVIPVTDGPEDDRRVIIPQRALLEVRRIYSVFRDSVDAPDNVELELTQSQAAFRFGNVELTTKTIEGDYPDYQRVIPKTANTEIVVGRSALAQAVKRTSLFSKNGLFDVRLEVKPEAKQLVLTATDVGRGENTVTIDCDIAGQTNAIVLNYRYVLDSLNAMPTERVTIRMIDGLSPCVVQPHEAPEEKYLCIVMPIRQ